MYRRHRTIDDVCVAVTTDRRGRRINKAFEVTQENVDAEHRVMPQKCIIMMLLRERIKI